MAVINLRPESCSERLLKNWSSAFVELAQKCTGIFLTYGLFCYFIFTMHIYVHLWCMVCPAAACIRHAS